MTANVQRRTGPAAWWFIGASVVTLLLGLYGDLAAWGIEGTAGALIVLCASGVLLAAALLLCLGAPPHWLQITTEVVVVIDLIGMLVATYFLEAYLMLVFTLLAALGWILWRARRHHHTPQVRS